MIPKIMHQAYLSGEPPAPLRENVEAHKVRNPDWQHFLWDENMAESFVSRHFGDGMLRTYRLIDSRYPAARVDLLCNLIIYYHGGVYFDIKSVFERPLNEVILPTDRYLLAQWDNGPGKLREGWGLHRDLAHIPGGEYMKHFIVAEPRHPYTESIIHKIVDNIRRYKPWHAVGRTGTLRTTGPIAYTLGVEAVKDPDLHRIVNEKEIGVQYSIGGDYNHQQALKKIHYSKMTLPIITQGRFGNWVSRGANGLRKLKSAVAR